MSGANPLAADLHVLDSHAPVELDGAVESEQLVDCGVHQGWIVAQHVKLVGVFEESDCHRFGIRLSVLSHGSKTKRPCGEDVAHSNRDFFELYDRDLDFPT